MCNTLMHHPCYSIQDTFISNSTSSQKSGSFSDDKTQWPPFYGYHEMNAETHALMSLLSMASVTFGDAVGEQNSTLIMQLCREDGTTVCLLHGCDDGIPGMHA